MPKRIRINIKSKLKCNASAVANRTFEGVDHIVIKGAKHMIGDSVMNGIFYSVDAMNTLNSDLGTSNAHIVAPAEHPFVNGAFISASNPLALIQHNVGAFHFNFRIENNRLVSDTAINSKVAELSDRGKEILGRIDNEEDIDISTGFYLNIESEKGTADDGDDFDGKASDLELDHSALLIESPGAKTTNQGVGLFANDAKGRKLDLHDFDLDQERVPATNSEKKTGWFNRILSRIGGMLTVNGTGEDLSHNDIRKMLWDILNPKGFDVGQNDEFAWIEEVWDNYLVYEKSGNLFRQDYAITSEQEIELIGEPLSVERKVTFEPNGDNTVRKILEAKLKAINSKLTDEEIGKLSEDDLMAKYESESETAFKANSDDSGDGDEAADKDEPAAKDDNSEVVPNWAKDLVGKVDDLGKTVNANSAKEKDQYVEVIANSDQYPGMDKDDLQGLDVEKLKKMASNCGDAFFVNGAHQQKSGGVMSTEDLIASAPE